MDWFPGFKRITQAIPRVIFAGFLCFGAGCAHQQSAPTEANANHGNGAHHTMGHGADTDLMAEIIGVDRLAEEFGIALISLRPTGGGHMLDLRYRVVDPDKADAVLRMASRIDVMVVHRPSKVVAHVPKTMLGKLRVKTANARPDRVYYVLFKNPHQTIQSGSRVDVHIGDLTVENWPVQ
jgi:hypothetical protein